MRRGGLTWQGLAGSVLALALAAGCSRPMATSPVQRAGSAAEDHVGSARDALLKSADLSTCRSVVQQLNQHMSQHANETRAELTEEQRNVLTQRFGLTADELGEVSARNLTALDAHYLEACLLFRDIARSLEVPGGRSEDHAAAAFAWVVRQVRLPERNAVPAWAELVARQGTDPNRLRLELEKGPLPPQFVLRRGWGTPLERSLVFFAVVQQLGLPSCLVALPGPSAEQPRMWACGILTAGGKEIELYDPRLGIPLPGPKGQGIAALAAVRTQPDLLKQLSVKPHEYDVTAEQARSAELYLAPPVAALAPRMAVAERLLGASLHIRLAVDPAALVKAFEEAAARIDAPCPPVRVAGGATRALRNFLPPEEGGTSTLHPQLQQQRPFLELPAWQVWPAVFKMGGDLERRLQPHFARPFLDFRLAGQMPRLDHLRGRFIYLGKPAGLDEKRMPFEVSLEELGDAPGGRTSPDEQGQAPRSIAEVEGVKDRNTQGRQEALDRARMPRDLVFRGRLDEAVKLLVMMRDQLRGQRDWLATNPSLGKEVGAWRERMVKAAGELEDAKAGRRSLDQARRQFEFTWVEGAKHWYGFLEAVAAQPLLEEATYQLALCQHERAERFQARLDRGKATAGASAEKVRAAWQDAAHWWDSFLAEHATSALSASAVRCRARVHAALGERDAAVRLLERPLPDLAPLESLGRAVEARRLKSP